MATARRRIPLVTRDNQQSGTIYVVDGSEVEWAFYCVDGVGRWYYDSLEEAHEQVGDDVPVIYADEADE